MPIKLWEQVSSLGLDGKCPTQGSGVLTLVLSGNDILGGGRTTGVYTLADEGRALRMGLEGDMPTLLHVWALLVHLLSPCEQRMKFSPPKTNPSSC